MVGIEHAARYAFRRLAIVAALVSAAGCASRLNPLGKPSAPAPAHQAGAKVVSTGSAAPNAAPTLADAMSFSEHREYNPTTREIGSGRAHEQVDYQSDLDIHLDKDKIEQIVRDRTNAPPLTPAELQQIQDLQQMLVAVQVYTNELTTNAQAARDAIVKARQAGNDPSGDPEYRKALQAEGTARSNLIEFIVQRTMAKFAISRTDAFRRVSDRFTKDALGRDVKLNTTELVSFIHEEIVAVQTAAANRADKNQLAFRIWANSYGRNNAALSLKPYNDVQDPHPIKAPRIGAGSAQEQQEFQAAYNAAATIAQQGKTAGEIASKVATELRQFSSEFADVEGATVQTELIASLRAAANRLLSDPTLKTQAQTLDTFAKDLETVPPAINRIRASIGTAGTGTDVLPVFFGIVTELERVAKFLDPAYLQNVSSALTAITQRLQADVGGLQQPEKDAVTKMIADLQKIATDELAKLVTAADPAKYPILAAVLGQLKDALTIANVGAAVGAMDPSTRAVNIDQIVDTTIHVGDTTADRGDRIQVTAELITPVSDGQAPEVKDTTTRTFDVDRFDWSSTLSANLVFVKRTGRGAPTDPDINFTPAPLAAWTLHYREPTDSSKQSNLPHVWRFLDPGFGLDVAALNFEKSSSVQIGMGCHATLFRDIVIVGYGWDLQASRDKGYFFVGISILDSLKQAGTLLSNGAK